MQKWVQNPLGSGIANAKAQSKEITITHKGVNAFANTIARRNEALLLILDPKSNTPALPPPVLVLSPEVMGTSATEAKLHKKILS